MYILSFRDDVPYQGTGGSLLLSIDWFHVATRKLERGIETPKCSSVFLVTEVPDWILRRIDPPNDFCGGCTTNNNNHGWCIFYHPNGPIRSVIHNFIKYYQVRNAQHI